MRYSNTLIKTNVEVKEFDSLNATLLQKGSFVHQTMAGVYTFLPLGLRVLNKIENIVREEMSAIGVELLLPALSPEDLWKITDRLESIDVLFEARGGNTKSRTLNDARYILGSTHEEVITPIIRHFKPSYKDLPFAAFQIQTKFRNEARPKSGLLRGREFRMKDLYSFHTSLEDFQSFYDKAKEVYKRTFDRLGLGADTRIVQASGGSFTKDYSHEFDTVCESGEDVIYLDEATGVYWNKEIAPAELMEHSEGIRASEVGNIFPLGTRFSEAFHYSAMTQSGEATPIYMGCYGIGTSRVLGVLVEKFHDEDGILWPLNVAPATIHLVGLNLDTPAVREQADKVYDACTAAGLDVLYDDRVDTRAGEKLADADLLGIPWRFVVSPKTGADVEIKRRGQDEVSVVDLTKALERVQQTTV